MSEDVLLRDNAFLILTTISKHKISISDSNTLMSRTVHSYKSKSLCVKRKKKSQKKKFTHLYYNRTKILQKPILIIFDKSKEKILFYELIKVIGGFGGFWSLIIIKMNFID